MQHSTKGVAKSRKGEATSSSKPKPANIPTTCTQRVGERENERERERERERQIEREREIVRGREGAREGARERQS